MKKRDTKKGFASKGVFPYQWAFTRLIPLRNVFLSPGRLIQRIHLQPDHSILEIGPGPGYFSVPIARKLTSGKLVLADIQPEMLSKAKKRLLRRNLLNVEYHILDGAHLPFADHSYDTIILVTVLGEVENKDIYMREFHRILKKDGLLSVSEQAGDPDQLSQDEIKTLAAGHGFHCLETFGTHRNFTLNFVKDKV